MTRWVKALAFCLTLLSAASLAATGASVAASAHANPWRTHLRPAGEPERPSCALAPAFRTHLQEGPWQTQ